MFLFVYLLMDRVTKFKFQKLGVRRQKTRRFLSNQKAIWLSCFEENWSFRSLNECWILSVASLIIVINDDEADFELFFIGIELEFFYRLC